MSKPPSIADRLRQARAARGMSQSGLAKGLNLTRGAVGQWETGGTSPNMDNIRAAAVLLNVDMDWLATGRGRGPGAPAVGESSREAEPPSDEAWVFPSSFIREAVLAPATRLVTIEVPGPSGSSAIEITVVGRAVRRGR